MEALDINSIADKFGETVKTLQLTSDNEKILRSISDIVEVCVTALNSENKIMFMGNGGSAADSQHLAAELVSRFEFDRPGLSALALTTDTSALTAIGNDYGYQRLFSRQIEAVGKKGDVLFGFSTSGDSENIILGLQSARKKGITTIGMTGNKKGEVCNNADFLIEVPSANTARIQEGHIVTGHIICGLIEQIIFDNK